MKEALTKTCSCDGLVSCMSLAIAVDLKLDFSQFLPPVYEV